MSAGSTSHTGPGGARHGQSSEHSTPGHRSFALPANKRWGRKFARSVFSTATMAWFSVFLIFPDSVLAIRESSLLATHRWLSRTALLQAELRIFEALREPSDDVRSEARRIRAEIGSAQDRRQEFRCAVEVHPGYRVFSWRVWNVLFPQVGALPFAEGCSDKTL